MIDLEKMLAMTPEQIEGLKKLDRKPTGYLALDEEGYLHPVTHPSPLFAVAKVTDCAGYSLVEKELGATLVSAEAVRLVARDPALKKLGNAAREAIETALAAIE